MHWAFNPPSLVRCRPQRRIRERSVYTRLASGVIVFVQPRQTTYHPKSKLTPRNVPAPATRPIHNQKFSFSVHQKSSSPSPFIQDHKSGLKQYITHSKNPSRSSNINLNNAAQTPTHASTAKITATIDTTSPLVSQSYLPGRQRRPNITRYLWKMSQPHSSLPTPAPASDGVKNAGISVVLNPLSMATTIAVVVLRNQFHSVPLPHRLASRTSDGLQSTSITFRTSKSKPANCHS